MEPTAERQWFAVRCLFEHRGGTHTLRIEPRPHARPDRAGTLFPSVQLGGPYQTLLVTRVLGAIQLGDEVEHLLVGEGAVTAASVGTGAGKDGFPVIRVTMPWA